MLVSVMSIIGHVQEMSCPTNWVTMILKKKSKTKQNKNKNPPTEQKEKETKSITPFWTLGL